MVEKVQLGDVCEFLDHLRKPVAEELRKPGPYPYYGANGLQGTIDNYLFDEPLVLLAEDGGHFGSTTKPIAYKVSGKTWVNNHAHVLRPNRNCDVGYLTHVLSYMDVSKYINGSTRPKLTKGNAEQIVISLPAIDSQRKLARLLDNAVQLRDLRRLSLKLYDEFFEASLGKLLEKTETKPTSLSDLCTKITDGVHLTPTYVDAGVPFLRVTDIQDDEIDWNSVKKIPPKEYEQISRRVKAELGDVLYSKNGTIGIAKEVTWSQPFAHFVSLALLKPVKDKLHPTFLAAWLNTPEALRQATAHSKTGTVTNLHLNEIEQMVVPLPSLSDQLRVVDFINQSRLLRATYIEAIRQADHLFQTLLTKAF